VAGILDVLAPIRSRPRGRSWATCSSTGASGPTAAPTRGVRPDFAWLDGDWFDVDPCSDRAEAPDYYAPDVVDAIRPCPVAQEIGCHSFAHVMAGDPGAAGRRSCPTWSPAGPPPGTSRCARSSTPATPSAHVDACPRSGSPLTGATRRRLRRPPRATAARPGAAAGGVGGASAGGSERCVGRAPDVPAGPGHAAAVAARGSVVRRPKARRAPGRPGSGRCSTSGSTPTT
jgi:hypothetical protein